VPPRGRAGAVRERAPRGWHQAWRLHDGDPFPGARCVVPMVSDGAEAAKEPSDFEKARARSSRCSGEWSPPSVRRSSRSRTASAWRVDLPGRFCLSLHRDAVAYKGSYSFYFHGEWRLHWGGWLLVADDAGEPTRRRVFDEAAEPPPSASRGHWVAAYAQRLVVLPRVPTPDRARRPGSGECAAAQHRRLLQLAPRAPGDPGMAGVKCYVSDCSQRPGRATRMKGRAVMSSMLDLPIAAMPSASKKRAKQTAHPDKGTESALCPTSTGRGSRALRAGDVRADRRTGLSRRHLRVHRYPARPRT